MEKVVIYGAGKMAHKVWKLLQRENETYQIIAVADSDKEKQGTSFEGLDIVSPETLKRLDFDKLIIAVVEWREVYRTIQNQWGIPVRKIENGLFIHKNRLFRHYQENPGEIDSEAREVLSYLESHPMEVFNYEFAENYNGYQADVHYDEECRLYFVMYYGKRMYMSSNFKSVKEVNDYCRNIVKEQDLDSPHSYVSAIMKIKEGSIVVDAGVAEGNFSLLIVDRVKKLYLVEADPGWAKALEYTFAPYRDKVKIVNKFLSSQNDDTHTTLDTMCKDEKIDVIKLDVEGCELASLHGAVNIVKKNNPLLIVCSYHNIEDEKNIRLFIEKNGADKYKVTTTNGYMVFAILDNMLELNEIKMVRGIIIGECE